MIIIIIIFLSMNESKFYFVLKRGWPRILVLLYMDKTTNKVFEHFHWDHFQIVSEAQSGNTAEFIHQKN